MATLVQFFKTPYRNNSIDTDSQIQAWKVNPPAKL